MTSAIAGRWTLTTTSSPDGRRAVWVWPIDAAASGSQSNRANTSSTGPSSASMTARTSSGGSLGARFCSVASSSQTPGGSRSTRVAAIWPSFTYTPPACSSTLRSRTPTGSACRSAFPPAPSSGPNPWARMSPSSSR